MIRPWIGLALLLVVTAPVAGGPPDDEARSQAQRLLDKGAATFDTRDAAAMAATYAEDARILLHSKKEGEGWKVDVTEGRGAIEAFYKDLFKDANEGSRARNTVESARLLAPDLLLIQGTFEPKAAGDRFPFVQVRVKQGEAWLMKSLQLFLLPKE